MDHCNLTPGFDKVAVDVAEGNGLRARGREHGAGDATNVFAVRLKCVTR